MGSTMAKPRKPKPKPADMLPALTFTLYCDTSGEWRWKLQAGNNRTIAGSGESYRNKGDCLDAIGLIQQRAAAARIQEDQ